MSQSYEQVTGADGLAVLSGRPNPIFSLAADPFSLVLAGAVLVIVGAAVVVWLRSTDSRERPEDRSSGDAAEDEPGERSTHGSFEEAIDETTLERLTPIVPDAVDRVRDRKDGARDHRTAEGERLEHVEQELRRALTDALADGRLDVGRSTPGGDPYEIVNLPARYREVSLPPSGQTVHVEEIDAAIRELLESGSLRDVSMAVAAVDDHREEVHQHVRSHEAEVVNLRNEIDATFEDVRELTTRLDGPLANRVEEFVLEGRHDDIDGVAEIERDVSDAMHLLQRCSFEDARRDLRRAREAADELLVTVDFLGGLVGTVEHGNGTVEIPRVISTALVSDLAPIIERQYDVNATVDGTAIVIAERDTSGEGGEPTSVTNAATVATEESSACESTGESATNDRTRVATGDVADEVLFVLRELDGSTAGDTVQYQTERLPDEIARPAVLDELAAFCRRQTDIVAAVDLQEGAPPGFLELEFTERTTPSNGLETVRERFVERHGG
ncbi:hypothetical protein [Natrinema sp. 74]|uniref:hypothetical protein n=1 Tax=Natrinema sp. 74 TaxID=3384159 RepID=UPI0038D3F553